MLAKVMTTTVPESRDQGYMRTHRAVISKEKVYIAVFIITEIFHVAVCIYKIFSM